MSEERPKVPPTVPVQSVPIPDPVRRWLGRAPVRQKQVHRAMPRPVEDDA